MFTVDDFINLFTYLKDKSTILELDDVIVALSESERAKAKELFSTSIDQIVHNTQDHLRLKNFLIDWYATHKTITSIQKQTSDVYLLPEEQLNELLLSFGYNFLNQPLFSKQNFLLELITLYKGKGTPTTLKRLLDFLGFSNTDLVEYWLHAVPAPESLTDLWEGMYFFDFTSTFTDTQNRISFVETDSFNTINFINAQIPPSIWVNTPRNVIYFANSNNHSVSFDLGWNTPNFGLGTNVDTFSISLQFKLYNPTDTAVLIKQGSIDAHGQDRFKITVEYENSFYSSVNVYLGTISGNWILIYKAMFNKYFLHWYSIYWEFSSNPVHSKFILHDLNINTTLYKSTVPLTTSVVLNTYSPIIYIGSDDAGTQTSNFLNGFIANVIISNYFLSENQILESYTGTISPGNYENNFNLMFRSQLTDDSADIFNWPDIAYDEIVSNDPHWLYTEEETKQLILNSKLTVPTKTPYFTFRPNYRQSTLEGITSLVFRILLDQYKSATNKSLIINENTLSGGEFLVGDHITGVSSSASAIILSIIYPNKITISQNGTTEFTIEQITNGVVSANVNEVLSVSESYNDYVQKNRVFQTTDKSYLTPLELYLSCVYSYFKLQYEMRELYQIPDVSENDTRINYYSGDIPVKQSNYDKIIDQYSELIDSIKSTNDKTRHEIRSENYTEYIDNFTSEITFTDRYKITYIEGSMYGTDFIVGDNLYSELTGASGFITKIAYDSSNLIQAFFIATASPLNDFLPGIGLGCVRSGSVFAMETFSYAPLGQNYILRNHGSAGTILEQLNPEYKLSLDLLFATGTGEEIVIDLMKDFINWVMINVRFDFPNIAAITLGGNLAFRGIFEILNFFKPIRARYIQGSTDFSYIVDNKLFESVVVEDIIYTSEQIEILERGSGGSSPEYIGFDYVDGEVVLDSTSYILGDSRRVWDTGSFFDNGIVDDLDHFDIFERSISTDSLYLKTPYAPSQKIQDTFLDTWSVLLQNHLPTNPGTPGVRWHAFPGYSNLHAIDGCVVDLGVDGNPSFYYADNTLAYNHSVTGRVRCINSYGVAWLLMRAVYSVTNSLEYYGVKIVYNQPGSYLQISIVTNSAEEGNIDIVRWTVNLPVVGLTHVVKSKFENGIITVWVNSAEIVKFNIAIYGDLISGVGYSGLGLSQTGTSYRTDGIKFDSFSSATIDHPTYNFHTLNLGEVSYAEQAFGWSNYPNQIIGTQFLNDVVEITVNDL